MGSKVHYTSRRALGLFPGTSLARVRRVLGTTRIERFLLMATMVILLFEYHVPTVGRFSIAFLWFAVLAGYVVHNRFQDLFRTWLHPVFLAAYAFLGLACIMESFHPDSSYEEISRIGLMVGGAVLISSLCRDKRALRAAIGGYLVAAILMSVVLFMTTYGALSAATGGGFDEASRVRAQVSAAIPLSHNLNSMASIAATGAVLALVFALTAKSFRLRILFLGAAAFCVIATFLPLSRTGVVILAVTAATVMFAFGVNVRAIITAIIVALFLGACVFMWVPEAVFSRMTFSLEANEARAKIYSAAIDHFSEYVLVGVGAGNFYGNWGTSSEFYLPLHKFILPAHNAFVQVTIYWGLVGFFALLMVIWQAYRCVPKRCGLDSLSLCLMGIAIAVFLKLFAASDLYGKPYSLLLGMLVGARYWIWPDGIVPSSVQEPKPLYPHSKAITTTQSATRKL